MTIRGRKIFKCDRQTCEKIENPTRDDRRVTLHAFSAMLPQIPRPSLHEPLTEILGYRKVSPRKIPKQLAEQYRQVNQVQSCKEFLER